MTIPKSQWSFDVGEEASLRKTFSSAEVSAFAAISGDCNPIHLDDGFAAQTRFGRRIVHGMLVGGLISAVLGTRLPGPGCIYLSQTLKFRAPVFIGDSITAVVRVLSKREHKPIFTLQTTCTNEAGDTVIEGEAVILVPMADIDVTMAPPT